MSQRAWFLAASLIAGGCMVVGCGDDTSKNAIDPDANVEVVENGFESDDPSGKSGSSSGGADGGLSAGSSTSSTSSGGAAPPASEDSASRAIQEADIVKLDGNRLYALSQYGGLAIVDVTDPNRMQLLGRKRTEGMPFEFYVENGRAHVMLNDFGRWVDEGGGKWVQTSELLELDVTNPASITEVGHYDVPGSISDSRLVGNTLYLVTMENGYCWRCDQSPSTVVTSFAVGGTAVAKIDQIAFRAPRKDYSWWQRSVSATNQRLYIGGPSWSWSGGDENRGSVIQVVDISDMSGKLKRGADVAIAGNINSRWQMDEHEGVLRVVSQYGNGWWGPNGSINPRVQTFTVTSAASITPLGQTELILPEPESLRSVRFDGVRGYAITAMQTDPLYTIDLSNPAQPKQAAALEIPGWIFHMEPRGDRLVGFGYEDTTWNGKLAVSLFDVSDLTKPTMLTRVAFGTGGGNLPEDQDRVHKAIRVLDQQGTILVPFSSYGRWDGTSCEQPATGIQIIDYAKTGLTLRGVAPYSGQPRRAMLLPNNRLLGMSDRNVSTFDLTNRDAPKKTNELDLSNPAYHMVETPTHIAAITNQWWSGEAVLALTPKDKADDANAVGKVSLAELAEPAANRCNPYGWASWYDARLFANGTTVWLTLPVSGDDGSAGHVVVAAIDTSNPAAPKIVGRTNIPLTPNPNGNRGGYYGGYFYCGVGSAGWGYYNAYDFSRNVLGSGDDYVKVGNKLAYLEIVRTFVDDAGRPYSYEWSPENPIPPDTKGYHWDYKRKLHVVDFANPASPTHERPVTLPASIGTTPLHVLNGVVMTSRWVYGSAPGKVRFYMDRVDLNGATTQLASVNIPGSLLHVDAASSRIVATDYKVERKAVQSYEECYKHDLRSQFIYDENVCIKVDRSFKLADVAGTKVTLRQAFTPPSQHFNGVQLADDRIYVTHERVYDYRNYQGTTDAYGSYVWNPPIIEEGGLWAIGGLRGGSLSIVSEIRGGNARWPLAASGTKVAIFQDSGMAVFDTASAQPQLMAEAKLRGWGYSSNVLLSQDRAIASLGEWGLQSFSW
ncbi:MAG: beta-propeller domain-containing protein [Labilithrix sp.]|nr:beta-propeller domain-containing protein [Labilithrix sp.]MCW5816287.1 beta-propeller domain-containing protein [Labilithrix sp.]